MDKQREQGPVSREAQATTRAGPSSSTKTASNEYVLNVAFFSFLAFVIIQTVFAIVANSQSMLADSEAMAVDSLTYLFNLVAERIKNRPLSTEERNWSIERQRHRRKLQRLYLELITPLISVSALIVITVWTLQEAIQTLKDDESSQGKDKEDDVSVPIMLLFSTGNLLLDVVNVFCFARADSAFGLDVVRRENRAIRNSFTMTTNEREEIQHLVQEEEGTYGSTNPRKEDVGIEGSHSDGSHTSSNDGLLRLVNLNMCSAWTHVCADTLRSMAVLIAAAIATCFPQWVSGEAADAVAAVTVSIIILVSLFPLLQGLVLTAIQIRQMHINE